jgi:hypothetical protein
LEVHRVDSTGSFHDVSEARGFEERHAVSHENTKRILYVVGFVLSCFRGLTASREARSGPGFALPNEPNTACIDGTMTRSTFGAMLTCLNNSTSGTLSATWDGSACVGSANFGGSTPSLRVQLWPTGNGVTLAGR